MGYAEQLNLLLDTCCFIWAVADPDSLSKDAITLFKRDDSIIFVSPISLAEIACAVYRGRLQLDQHWKLWFRKYLKINKWKLVNIDLKIIEEAYSLPDSFHSDPADRIMTATAILNNYTILTADKKIIEYPHVNNCNILTIITLQLERFMKRFSEISAYNLISRFLRT